MQYTFGSYDTAYYQIKQVRLKAICQSPLIADEMTKLIHEKNVLLKA
jgi:hypothetical protein